jgi:hypothetical protein
LLSLLASISAVAAGDAAPTAGEPSAGESKTVSVAGNQPWTFTGVAINAGDSVSVHASGTIFIAGSDPGKTPAGAPGCVATSDNDSIPPGPFLAPGLTCFALIGRVGTGQPFGIGADSTFTATGSGELVLGVNDNFFGDNRGGWTVLVSVVHGETGMLAPVAKGVGVTVVHGYNDPPRQTGETPLLCVIASARDHCANQQFGLDLRPGAGWDRQILAPAAGTVGATVTGAGGPCLLLRLDDGVNANVCHFAAVTSREGSRVARGDVLGRAATPWIHLSLDRRPETCSGGWRLPANRSAYFCPVQLTGVHAFEGHELAWDGHTPNQWKDWQVTSTNG